MPWVMELLEESDSVAKLVMSNGLILISYSFVTFSLAGSHAYDIHFF